MNLELRERTLVTANDELVALALAVGASPVSMSMSMSVSTYSHVYSHVYLVTWVCPYPCSIMPTPARATRWSRVTQGSPSGPLGRKKGEVGVDTTPSSSSILEINLEFPRCSSHRTAALLESGSNRRTTVTTVTTVTTALSQVGRRTRNQTLVLLRRYYIQQHG